MAIFSKVLSQAAIRDGAGLGSLARIVGDLAVQSIIGQYQVAGVIKNADGADFKAIRDAVKTIVDAPDGSIDYNNPAATQIVALDKAIGDTMKTAAVASSKRIGEKATLSDVRSSIGLLGDKTLEKFISDKALTTLASVRDSIGLSGTETAAKASDLTALTKEGGRIATLEGFKNDTITKILTLETFKTDTTKTISKLATTSTVEGLAKLIRKETSAYSGAEFAHLGRATGIKVSEIATAAGTPPYNDWADEGSITAAILDARVGDSYTITEGANKGKYYIFAKIKEDDYGWVLRLDNDGQKALVAFQGFKANEFKLLTDTVGDASKGLVKGLADANTVISTHTTTLATKLSTASLGAEMKALFEKTDATATDIKKAFGSETAKTLSADTAFQTLVKGKDALTATVSFNFEYRNGKIPGTAGIQNVSKVTVLYQGVNVTDSCTFEGWLEGGNNPKTAWNKAIADWPTVDRNGTPLHVWGTATHTASGQKATYDGWLYNIVDGKDSDPTVVASKLNNSSDFKTSVSGLLKADTQGFVKSVSEASKGGVSSLLKADSTFVAATKGDAGNDAVSYDVITEGVVKNGEVESGIKDAQGNQRVRLTFTAFRGSTNIAESLKAKCRWIEYAKDKAEPTETTTGAGYTVANTATSYFVQDPANNAVKFFLLN